MMFPGTYYHRHTVSVTSNNVVIASVNASEPTVLTGAVPMSGLTWTQSPLGQDVVMATLPPGAVHTDGSAARGGAGLTLTVDGVVYTLARWPNANPLFDRFPTGFSHHAEAQLPPARRPPTLSMEVATPTDPHSNFPTYHATMVNSSLWHEGGSKSGTFPPVSPTDRPHRRGSGTTGTEACGPRPPACSTTTSG